MNPFSKFAIYRPNIEHDDEATYLVTPNRYCQNPSHAHHYSHHHHQSSYRHSVAHTVFEEANPEESTGGSIVTVINNTASILTNDSTPDIVLTNSDTPEPDTQTNHTDDEHLSTAARSLSIKSIDNEDELGDPSTSLTTVSQATETIPNNNNNNNNNDEGTGSLQKLSFECELLQTHNKYGIWAICYNERHSIHLYIPLPYI